MTHITLIAPSSPASEKDVACAKAYFEALGMRVSAPANLLGQDLLCAHRDEMRWAHLKNALSDDSTDIVWLLRGGYGLTRLIPQLLTLKKPEKEKLFIGFSDGSALHMFLNQVWDWPSLHAPSAAQISQQTIGEQTIAETLSFLKDRNQALSLKPLTPLNTLAHQMTSLEGRVIGGNLCLATCTLGTALHVKAKDKILFLEDIDERGYRVDRMLMQLHQAGALEGVKAILFGDFVRGEEKDGTSLIEHVIHRFSQEIQCPVFRLEGYGHGQDNFPLPLNVPLAFSIVDNV